MAERNIGKEILEGLRELKRDRTGRSTMVSQVSPGEMLHEEFLKPLRMSHHGYDKGMDFADALHLASAHKATAFFTFDRSLVRDARRAGVAVELVPD